MRIVLLFAAALATVVAAHGSHGGPHGGPYGEEARTDYPNWMARHMAEEHGMESFDALSFFTLHDFDGDGVWEKEEMQRMYGLMDVTNKDVSYERREEIYRELLGLLDTSGDGLVSRDEFAAFVADGKTLPDFGVGPGHHGDDEYEYEVHHWNKYHNEDTKLEDLTHPEDIEHFKRHEEMEDAKDRQEAMDKLSIIEANIPAKFLRPKPIVLRAKQQKNT